jgi:hypothetical protein
MKIYSIRKANKHESRCRYCGKTVPAGEGVTLGRRRTGHIWGWAVAHLACSDTFDKSAGIGGNHAS